jgi:hypothetical protein
MAGEQKTMSKTLTALLNNHCRFEGETVAQFAIELRKLSPVDKEWFKTEFEKMGYTVIPS